MEGKISVLRALSRLFNLEEGLLTVELASSSSRKAFELLRKRTCRSGGGAEGLIRRSTVHGRPHPPRTARAASCERGTRPAALFCPVAGRREVGRLCA